MNSQGRKLNDVIDTEDLLHTLLKGAPFGIILVSPDGSVLLVNSQALGLLSLSRKEDSVTGIHISEFCKSHPRLAEVLSDFIDLPVNHVTFDPANTVDGSLEISVLPLKKGFLILLKDSSEMKKLEANSVQAIIAGQERERRRLAWEIHDGIAPLLSSVKLELDLFLEELRELDQEIPLEKLMNIRGTIDTISTDLRNFSHRLMPRLLEEFGLLSAIQNLVTRAGSTTKAHVELICNLNAQERFEKEIEINLFRCCQELMANSIRHAGASRITVQLIKHESSIVLMVEDDGKGIDPEHRSSANEGIGLLNIETRARTLSGEFILESVKGKGTLISIELPI